MLFHCHRVQANFRGEKLGLVNRDQTKLLWDEHGGTFVLRVEGLEVVEVTEAPGETEIRLEVDLPEPASLAHRIESFAGRHSLRVDQRTAIEVISETPILVACHIPGNQLFIYCEEPRLTLRLSGKQTLELRIDGVFKSRRVPCQETDLVIHLEMATMGRVLAGMLGWAARGA